MKQWNIWNILCSVFCIPALALLLFCSAGCGSPKEENAVLLARALERAKEADWKDALKLTEAAVDQDPSDAAALIFHALALEKTLDQDQALDQAAAAVRIAPDDFIAQYTLGRMLYEKGKYDRALAPLMKARRLRPSDANTVVLLAQTTARLNNSAALGYYRLLAQNPRFRRNPAVWSQIGTLYLIRHDPGKALTAYREAGRLAPENPNVALNLAVVNDFYLNNKAEASTYYNKYQRLTANSPDLTAKRLEVVERLRRLQN